MKEFARNVVISFGIVGAGIGFLWYFSDPRNQTYTPPTPPTADHGGIGSKAWNEFTPEQKRLVRQQLAREAAGR